MSAWQMALALLAAAAYAVLSHWLMLHAAAEPWAVAALLGPLLAVVVGVAWRNRQWPMVAGGLAACAVLAGVVARGGVAELSRLYVLQHVGINAALGISFGLSLRGEQMSLISRIAERVHGTLSPGMLAYTWRVTAAWTIYFFAMAAVSVAVYALAPWSTWSLLANVGTPVAVALMFVGEHWLRYWLHPEFERASLMDAVRAFRDAPVVEAAGR
ncbi:hypothetical protein [Ideonella sp. BN130291]|uniref:hypothetical protein n=1 Tax=Ideonella sp. BN130291 TaxID=3112940 RepID=UPI002E2634BC|nr:hypothetical protein [Ideonella sp. BN130291]